MDNEELKTAGNETGSEEQIEVTAIEKKKKKTDDPIKNFYDWIEMFVLAITIVLIVFSFVLRICTVDGKSMEQTLSSGEKVVVQELFYTPEAGDIVVVQSHTYNNKPLVKRIIAVGGQKMKIDFSTWTVTVNGKTVKESYAYNFNGSKVMEYADYYTVVADHIDADGYVTIPEGYVFVMGDNRNNSRDSRFSEIGFVEYQEVMGKVIFDLSKFKSVN
ncbi:MAG: signal peptidase I [Clostridia bacterium]|nr:signal peptidase I [Clostridia bacterium]